VAKKDGGRPAVLVTAAVGFRLFAWRAGFENGATFIGIVRRWGSIVNLPYGRVINVASH
jgi:hypothetical protein